MVAFYQAKIDIINQYNYNQHKNYFGFCICHIPNLFFIDPLKNPKSKAIASPK